MKHGRRKRVVNINNGVRVTVVDGAGTDLSINADGDINVNGFLRLENNATITSLAASLAINNGGTYQHNYTTVGGAIPTASWNTGSTCLVIGYTTFNGNPAGGYNQPFYNFTWNRPNQTVAGIPSLGGVFTGGVSNNFTVISTGAGTMALSNTADFATTIKNFILSGGTLILSNGGADATLNLTGDFTMSGGTLQRNSNGLVNFRFTGVSASPQIFSKTAGTISGVINFQINPTATGAVVNFGTSILDGANATFNIANGGTLITANTNATGAITTSGANGSIQVGGTRTFSSGAHYVFNGTANQVTGSGLSQPLLAM